MLYTATQQDAVMAAAARGERDEAAERLNDLLLPLVKGVGSERSYELLSQSLQVLGGSGYLQDYPVEQYLRDAKIDTLYEGTTSIQGLDLFFRKIVKDNGVALGALAAEIGAFAAGEDGNGRLKEERALLATALGDVQAMVGAMVGFLTSAQEDLRSVYKIGQNTTRLLLSLGDLVVGWLLLRQAAVALAALDGGSASAAGPGVLRGKGGGGPVLRHLGAAGADRAPGGRRGDRQRADGRAGGELLTSPPDDQCLQVGEQVVSGPGWQGS